MKLFSMVLVCVSLVGCANISTVKVNRVILEDEHIMMVPTGKFSVSSRAESNPAAGGGLAGAIFAVADAIQASTYSKRMNEVIPGAVRQDDLIRLTTSVIRENINVVGSPKGFIESPPSQATAAFTEWFNPESRSDFKFRDDKSVRYAIDFGFNGLSVVRYGTGMYVEGWLGIRLIDLNTGAVVARSRTWGVGSISGERVQADIGDPDLEKSVQNAIKTFVSRLGKEALNKMAEK